MHRTPLPLALFLIVVGVAPAPAQDAERAFGRIEPGGAPVEIDEGVPTRSAWEPTGPVSSSLLEPRATPTEGVGTSVQPRDVAPARAADDPVLRMLEADLRAAEARTRGDAERVDTGSLPLGVPSASLPLGSERDSASSSGGWRDLARTGAALGAVLTLAFGLAWGFKKLGIAGGGGRVLQRAAKSPSGLLEVLGRYPLAGRQTLIVLRFDQRVLLLSQRAGGDLCTLCELNDPEEVAGVLLRVRDAAGDSAAAAFEEAIAQAESSYDHDGWEPDTYEQAEAMRDVRRVYTTDEGDRAELAFAQTPAGGRESSLLSGLRSRRR